MTYNSFERSINARKQLRGKDGRWIYEGGSVKFWDALKGVFQSGTVSGFNGDYVDVQTSSGTSKVHRTKITSIPKKATLGGSADTTKADFDAAPTKSTVTVDGTEAVKQKDGNWYASGSKETYSPDDLVAKKAVISSEAVDESETSGPRDISNWTQGKSMGGSNGAKTYTDEDGNEYVVKFLKSDDHAKNEVLASRLYDLAGTPTPGQELITKDGKLGVASPLVPNDKGELSQHLNDKDFIAKLHDDFAVDAWLANWDVAGLTYDNVLADENSDPIRIDPGGALIYRAMGTPKGSAFGDSAGEWETLRTSAQGKTIFGSMSEEKAAESAKKLQSISDKDIDEIVDSVDFDEKTATDLKATLKARRDDVLVRAGLDKTGESTISKADLDTVEAEVEEPEEFSPITDPDALRAHLDEVGIQTYIDGVDDTGIKVQYSGTKAQVGDVFHDPTLPSNNIGVIVDKHTLDSVTVRFPDGTEKKKSTHSTHIKVYRPTEAVAPTQAPEDSEAPDTSPFNIVPADARGKSGDGYHASGPWGKYGASGLMIHAQDTDKFYIVQRGGIVSSNKGKWQLPGGAMEQNEDAYQGAARELVEETSFGEDNLKNLSHAGDVVFDNEKGWQYTNIAANLPNEIEIEVDPQESAGGEWVTAEELLDMQKAGELVPAFAANLDKILAAFNKPAGEEEVVDIPEAQAEDINLPAPTSAVQNIKGKGVKAISTADNGQGVTTEDHSDISLSGVEKGNKTTDPQDIQSANIGQKVYDPSEPATEWERTGIDAWVDENLMQYSSKEMQALVTNGGLYWGSKEDYEAANPSEPEPKSAVPDVKKEYEWAEVSGLVKDFHDNVTPGDYEDVSAYKLADGTKLMFTKTGDEDLDGIEVLPVGLEAKPSNWKGPISWRDALISDDISEDIEDLAFGGSANEPSQEPRLSKGSDDLDSMPTGSVVKFNDASDSQVYLKNDDGTWSASWLDDAHPQKNVTPAQIHAVAAYLGKDVQVMKEENNEPEPHSGNQDQEDNAPAGKADLNKNLIKRLGLSPDDEIGDFLDKANIGDIVQITEDNGNTHVFTKKEEGTWTDANGEEWDEITLNGAYGPEDLSGYTENSQPQEEEETTPTPATETPKFKTYDAEDLGIIEDNLTEKYAAMPVGTEVKYKNEQVWTKEASNVWTSPGYNNKSDAGLEGNYYAHQIEEIRQPRVSVPESSGLVDYPVENFNENSLDQQFKDLPIGSEIVFEPDDGVYDLFYKKTNGSWSNGEETYTAPDEELASQYYAHEINSVKVPSDFKPEAPAAPEPEAEDTSIGKDADNLLNKLMNLGDTPDTALTVDGINYDSQGNAWVPDKTGKALRIGSIVTSKAGEKGQIDFIQKGGKKVRVKTEDGNTKFWNAHLVDKADATVTFDNSNNKYAIQTDENGVDYLTSPDGDRIYVGDTVVSSGKTGFEGTVAGFKNGEFVLVHDPSDNKVKPRKIDKIKLVSSANPQAPAKEEPKADVDIADGDSVPSVDALGAAPVGSKIKWAGSTSSSYFVKKDDGTWQYISEISGETNTFYDSDEFVNSIDSEILAWKVGDDAPEPSPAPTAGEVADDYMQIIKAPYGSKLISNTDSNFGYQKRPDGMWDEWYKGDKNEHYTISPTDLESNSKQGKLTWTDGDLADLTLEKSAAEPEAAPSTFSWTEAKDGDVVTVSKEDLTNAPVGTAVLSTVNNGYAIKKTADNTWQREHIKSGYNSGSEWTDEQIFALMTGGETTVYNPEPKTTTSGWDSWNHGQKLEDISLHDVINLPTGSTFLREPLMKFIYTKVDNDNWSRTNLSTGAVTPTSWDDIEIMGLFHDAKLTVYKAEQVATAPDSDKYGDGKKPSGIKDLEDAPVGTILGLDSNYTTETNYFTKTDKGDWVSKQGYEYESSMFIHAINNDKVAFSTSAAPAPAPVPEPTQTTPAPNIPSLPGKNNKNVSVGAIVSYSTPNKNKSGKVVSIDIANGDVVFIDDATGKKAKHKAKFLTVDAESTASSAGSLTELSKDPSSPWFEKPEPTAPKVPTGLNTEFAMPGLLEEISENYKKEKGKEFSNSSYFNQYEQLSKNGSEKPTVSVNETKYGPQSDLFDFFAARGYISKDTAVKAREHFNKVKTENSGIQDEYNVKNAQYSQDIIDWKIANGIPLGGFVSATYQPSASAAEILNMIPKTTKTAEYGDAMLPAFADINVSERDKAVFQIWVGGGNYNDPADPSNNIPYVNWSPFSQDLRTHGKAGHLDPTLLQTDHAKVKKAITDAIEKSVVPQDMLMTRSGMAKNFTGPNGESFSNWADLKSMVGSVVTDYGVFAGSPGHRSGYNTNNLEIKVRVPQGAHAAWLGGKNKINTGEKEMLLPPGSKFLIHDVIAPSGPGSDPTVVVDLVPENWTPAAGQTTQAVNKPQAGPSGGPVTSPAVAVPSAP